MERHGELAPNFRPTYYRYSHALDALQPRNRRACARPADHRAAAGSGAGGCELGALKIAPRLTGWRTNGATWSDVFRCPMYCWTQPLFYASRMKIDGNQSHEHAKGIRALQPRTACGSEISVTVPDWSREACGRLRWDPPRQFLRSLRLYERAAARPGFFWRTERWLAVLEHRFWSVVCGVDIPLGCHIGGGLLMPHPNGIVIHPEAVLGPNCLLFQQVTIGAGPKPGVPRLGGHVDVGAGAKILGGVQIGDHARIGANAVVVDDIPTGATVAGVPARVVSS